MNKKVGILTLSASDNCGSLLQAYALQTLLDKYLMNDAVVINYNFQKSREMYDVIPNNFYRHPRDTYYRLLHIRKLAKQKRDYEYFRDRYLKMTEKVYRREAELKKEQFDFDVTICGSDQVWNVLMSDFDHAFFLDWVHSGKKLAYAPSLGGNKLLDGFDSDYLKGVFESFSALSAREITGKEQIEAICNKSVHVLLDPTLLLDYTDWDELTTGNPFNEDYIFFYSYSYHHNDLNRIVQEFAKQNNLKVIVINASKWYRQSPNKYGFTLYEDSGPLAFLNLMKYAKTVFVQSFHGVIFANMFKKEFYFLDDHSDNSLDPRLDSILTLLDRKERVVRSLHDITGEAINYGKENTYLSECVYNSINYLDTNI